MLLSQSSVYNLLVVDDEINVAHALKRMLRHPQLNIYMATSAEDGLVHFEKYPIHLVISDYKMPGTNGVKFLAAVHQRFPNVVKILLSGYVDPQVETEVLREIGVSGYFQKPWDDDEIAAYVQRALLSKEPLHLNLPPETPKSDWGKLVEMEVNPPGSAAFQKRFSV